MPKPKARGPRGKGRRPARGKVTKQAPGPKAKARTAKPPAGRAPEAAQKKEVTRPARAAPPASPPAAPPIRKGASTVAAPVEKRKEATRMSQEVTTCPIHGVADCFKPALDAHIQKAYDGYCTKIDWPLVRIIPKGWKPSR